MTAEASVPVLTDLTPFEREVVHAARHGEIATRDGPSIEDLAKTDDPDRRIRAELIRELLLCRHGPLDPRGIRVSGARIVGDLNLDWIQASTGLSLTYCALPDPVTAENAHLAHLDLSGSQLFLLHADRLQMDGSLILQGAILHRNTGDSAIQLIDAHISGRADFRNLEVTNDSGPALYADGLRVDSHLILTNAIVRGNHTDGAMRLHSAHTGDRADFRKLEVTNDSGAALHADGLRVDSDLTLEKATVRSNHPDGAIRLLGAHIGDQADFEDAEIINDGGPALYADGIRTGGDMILRGTTVRGTGDRIAVRLLGAHIGGQLSTNGMEVNNRSGALIALYETRVDGAVFLPVSVICTESRWAARGPCPQQDRHIILSRFSFAELHFAGWQQWLHLIRHHTPTYAPHPYQQVAAIERAAGHDNNARAILIAQQDDLRRRNPNALGGRIAQARHWAWGWLGRYGYRASRLLAVLATTLILAGAVGWVAGQVSTRPGHHAAERVPSTTAPANSAGIPCSAVELIGLGIDRGLPLGVTGLRAKCDLDTGTRRGEAFTVVIWLIQAAVWALATLAVASYTGLIRKPA